MNEKLTKIESVIREVCTELPRYPLYTTNSATIPADVMGRINAGEVVMIPTPYTSNDINLEHILRALNEMGKDEYVIDTYGIVRYNAYNDDYRVAYFDLTHHLHLQSDEFISWLYETLCSN